MSYHQAKYDEPIVFAIQGEDDCPVETTLPKELQREELNIPNLEESQLARHFVRLSQMNYGVDTGFYPLGSCTMKYNCKFVEEAASHPGFTGLHPLQPEATAQGAMQVMHELSQYLAEIGGVEHITLQPCAGAHGEFTGLLLVHAYHAHNGDDRNQIILPDTSHGTNPASAAMMGYEVVEIASKDGVVDLEALKAALGPRTAAFMLTNPNTLGIFERDALEIARLVHESGALLYYDGANLNAIMGKTSPGKLGFDIVHFNLHKTFATPHGGGGPGAGPIGVKDRLRDFLPVPTIGKKGDSYYLEWDLPHTIGKISNFYGNFGVLLKAWLYIRLNGGDGLRKASERAVLNSNYLRKRLEDLLEVPYPGLRKHEFVASAKGLKERTGVSGMDLSKRLLDHGIHAPTVYFPLIVEEALMVEPTETESKESLDMFIDTIEKILKEEPDIIKSAPHNLACGRLDEVQAARQPILNWRMLKEAGLEG